MTLPPALLHKLGPLPVWAWGGIIGVGGLAAVAVFGGHKSSSVKSSGQQFATAPAGDSGGGGSAFGFPAGVAPVPSAGGDPASGTGGGSGGGYAGGAAGAASAAAFAGGIGEPAVSSGSGDQTAATGGGGAGPGVGLAQPQVMASVPAAPAPAAPAPAGLQGDSVLTGSYKAPAAPTVPILGVSSGGMATVNGQPMVSTGPTPAAGPSPGFASPGSAYLPGFMPSAPKLVVSGVSSVGAPHAAGTAMTGPSAGAVTPTKPAAHPAQLLPSGQVYTPAPATPVQRATTKPHAL